MPTGSEAAARHEASRLAAIDWPVIERQVIPAYDPASDLDARAAEWSYTFRSHSLGDLCRFAAGLAVAEADAWAADDPSVATKAYADRRFLLADRILPWSVPWLDARGRCVPEDRRAAERDRQTLLELGDHHRVAPAPAVSDLPGEDGYGPLDFGDLTRRLGSLWGGLAVFDVTARSVLGRADAVVADLVEAPDETFHLYRAAAARWRRLAADHPGSAAMWLDLAARAEATAALIR